MWKTTVRGQLLGRPNPLIPCQHHLPQARRENEACPFSDLSSWRSLQTPLLELQYLLTCMYCTCKLIIRPRPEVPVCGYPSVSSAIPLFLFTNQSFDSNGDGLVTKSELREALWSLGQHPCDEEIDNLFRVYDSRKVGALDSSDFRRLILAKLSFKVSKNMISYPD